MLRATEQPQNARMSLEALSGNRLLALKDGFALRAGLGGDEQVVTWELSATPSAVPSARRMVASRLRAWGLRDRAEAAETLAGVLVGQALRLAAGKITVSLSAEDGWCRCEVEQCPRPDGRTRDLLDRLACCWGVVRTAGGEAVWFELPEAGRR
ncbi:hypothetical protein E1295_24400 [Nonomuraea mesophila]|uniref:ATP-binding protein n=1 Tax=Nonomuraea mesophila TaxID=2530382 RepID=A0A4R5F9N4_9ACTN|nr:hypothetical protein [Nonomuraea mesophila]TDE45305.1 hypothetical protein E1295_24400 [Nonomuraea mesophila]